MGVGVQSEAGLGVAQDAGEGLGIHAAGQGMGGEGVPEVMEPQLRQKRVTKNPLGLRALLPLLQQLRRTGRQGDDPLACSCLGSSCGNASTPPAVDGAADREGPLLTVKVRPHEAADLTLPQSYGELRVEEVIPDGVLPDLLHEPLQLGIIEDLSGSGLLFGQCDALGGIQGDEPCPHRCAHGQVKYPVESADTGGGQGVSILRILPDTAIPLGIPVQLPDVVRGDLADGLAAQPGLDVVLDMMAVSFQSALPHGGCHQLLQPLVQPLPQGH